MVPNPAKGRRHSFISRTPGHRAEAKARHDILRHRTQELGYCHLQVATQPRNCHLRLSPIVADCQNQVYGYTGAFGISGSGSDFLALGGGGNTGYPPPAPVLQSATAQADALALVWDPVPGATRYRIKWGQQSGDYDDQLSVGPSTSHELAGLQADTTYFIVVQAGNQFGLSPESNELQSTPVAIPQRYRLSGTLSVDGIPVANTLLRLTVDGQAVGSTITDGGGDYSFEQVKPGLCQVSVQIDSP